MGSKSRSSSQTTNINEELTETLSQLDNRIGGDGATLDGNISSRAGFDDISLTGDGTVDINFSDLGAIDQAFDFAGAVGRNSTALQNSLVSGFLDSANRQATIANDTITGALSFANKAQSVEQGRTVELFSLLVIVGGVVGVAAVLRR